MIDIKDRFDIDVLVRLFYNKLLNNELMKPIFLDVIKIDFEAHFEILVDFWDNVLFHTGVYQRNAMLPHIELNKLHPFRKEHFVEWLALFNESVDELFTGKNANTAKERAFSIATIMEMKLN